MLRIVQAQSDRCQMNNLQLEAHPPQTEAHPHPTPLSERSSLRYQKHDSLKAMVVEGEKVTVETDVEFGDSLAAIVKSKASVLSELMGTRENALTSRECEEIHHKARLHARANLLNRNSGLDARAARKNRALLSQLCTCGCGRMEGELFELGGDLQRISLLGSGVLLFFFFLKALCFCLVGLALTQGVFALGSNLGGMRADKGCRWSCGWRDWTSHYNKENDWYAEIQGWLGLAGMLVWMVLARFLKFYGGERNALIDRSLTSASDYAIKIDNLPAGEFNEEELMQYINRIYERELEVLPPEQLAAILMKVPQKLAEMDPHARLQLGVVGVVGELQVGLQLVRKAVREAVHNDENPFGVRAVQVIYDMRFARQMVQKLSEQALVLNKQLIRLAGKLVVNDPELYLTRKRELINTHELLGDLRKKFLSDCEFRRKIATRSAIVEFEEEHGKQLVLDRFGRENMTFIKRIRERLRACCWGENQALVIRGSLPEIGRAPEPSDIIWQNCERQDSLARLIIILLATFLIILGSLGIIVALQAAQSYIESEKLAEANGSLGTFINLVSSLVLQLVNKLLWLSLSLLLALEYNHTNTVRIISQMAKSSTAMAVNVIVLPIIVNYVLRDEYFGASGLAGIVLDYHITALLISLPLKLLDPLALILRLSLQIRPLRNYLIRVRFGSRISGAETAGLMRKIYQLYEPPEFDIAEAYIFIISNVLHACFFCELQPLVILLVLLQVMLFYWVCKWRLLRFCKIPQLTEKLVFEVACYQAMLAPVFYGVGAIFNSLATSRSLSDQQFHFLAPAICVGIGLLNYSNPGDVFHRMTKWFANCCSCLQPENFLGSAAVVSKPQQPSLSAINSPMEAEAATRSVRVEDYYKYSNTLSLLGFERVLFGQSPGIETEEELRMYCESHVEDCGVSSESSKRASEVQSQEQIENERSDNILF